MRRLFVSLLVLSAAMLPAVVSAAAPPAELTTALSGFREAKGIRMTMSTDRGTVVVDTERPGGQMHVTMDGAMELIRIGDDTYLKRSGAWTKLPAMAAGMLQRGPLGALPSVGGDYGADATFTRMPDAADGTGPARVWKIVSGRAPGTATLAYVRIADGRIHRFDVTDAQGTTRSVTIDYLPNLDITAPQ